MSRRFQFSLRAVFGVPVLVGIVATAMTAEREWVAIAGVTMALLVQFATVDGTTRWSTSRQGISWQVVARVPPPTASRAERLRQMKQLAEGFSVHAVKTAPDYDEGSIWHLRMMAQPIHQYSEEAAVDGAIFAFAQGTDPEVFLIFESREPQGIGQWFFGFAPSCVWELHAKRGEREVWSRPKWNFQDPVKDYGLVGPFAVDPKLLPAESINAKPASDRED